jgi:excinuclease ABC subunit C
MNDKPPQKEQPSMRGIDVIKAVVRTLPSGPGVYRMLDAKGAVLYVGKARDLKKRVTNYTKLGGQTNRIARMISMTASMEIVTTHTETEALLLEANLIKQLKPRYNILLRDDKSFPYILIDETHPFPQIRKHRGARNIKGHYFGPFASAKSVNRTLNTMQRAFLLRSCSDGVFVSRSRPCLLFQIKRCSAPCTGEISEKGYRALVNDAADFLGGKSRKIQDMMISAMQKAAEDHEFESAANYRDRMRAITSIQTHQGINPETLTEADVVAAFADGGQTCIQVFFFRAGQNWGNRAFFPRHDKTAEPTDVLAAFLTQFYDDKPVPRMILLSHDIKERDLLAQALELKSEHKVDIRVPERGEKRALVEHAITNAREALARRISESSAQRQLLEKVAETFGLDAPPRRIEIYDNSHIQGSHPVGGMVVAGRGGFEKAQYRKFNIKNKDIAPGDDYAMMREVLTRRFSRLLKDHADRDGDDDSGKFPAWPDIVLIDGGKGQLSVAMDVFADLGVEDVTLVSIAKGPDRDAGRERFFMPGREPFSLDGTSPVMYFLQRLRDEAHRFAIGSHRARRTKAISSNPLDEIGGIGAARKKALLLHFGSAKGVSRAGLADLEAVEGISKAMAKRIYDHFHSG